jgi:bidirectional [NiFe] hydrogenase diaphorase subunit
MPAQLARPSPPTDDRRWRVVDTAMRRQGYAGDALIEALHAAQETFGCLDDVTLRYVADSLGFRRAGSSASRSSTTFST